jgi:hypothetical protein
MSKEGEKERKRKRHKTAVHYQKCFRNASGFTKKSISCFWIYGKILPDRRNPAREKSSTPCSSSSELLGWAQIILVLARNKTKSISDPNPQYTE